MRPTLDKSLFSSFFFSTCWSKGISRKSSSQQMKLTVHPIQTGWGQRPHDPFNASVLVINDYSSWKSARQVWALFKHSRAFQSKSDPTGVIPSASASSCAMFALTTKLSFRSTHQGSRKDWRVRGKSLKTGMCSSLMPRATCAHTLPEPQETQLAFSVNKGRCTCDVRCVSSRKQLGRYKRGLQVMWVLHYLSIYLFSYRFKWH